MPQNLGKNSIFVSEQLSKRLLKFKYLNKAGQLTV